MTPSGSNSASDRICSSRAGSGVVSSSCVTTSGSSGGNAGGWVWGNGATCWTRGSAAGSSATGGSCTSSGNGIPAPGSMAHPDTPASSTQLRTTG